MTHSRALLFSIAILAAVLLLAASAQAQYYPPDRSSSSTRIDTGKVYLESRRGPYGYSSQDFSGFGVRLHSSNSPWGGRFDTGLRIGDLNIQTSRSWPGPAQYGRYPYSGDPYGRYNPYSDYNPYDGYNPYGGTYSGYNPSYGYSPFGASCTPPPRYSADPIEQALWEASVLNQLSREGRLPPPSSSSFGGSPFGGQPPQYIPSGSIYEYEVRFFNPNSWDAKVELYDPFPGGQFQTTRSVSRCNVVTLSGLKGRYTCKVYYCTPDKQLVRTITIDGPANIQL